jgi:branched-chain amino acid transport system ATP-binding protein
MSLRTHHANDDLLVVENLTLRYGALTAVDDVSLRIASGARHALIGPNGAGKSSFFSMLGGATSPTSGRIVLGGEDIISCDEVARARAGLVRTYQHSSLFTGLSVLDNVRIAVERVSGRPLRPWPSRADRRIATAAEEYLAHVGLVDRRDQLVASLSHGERRQLEVALVLACEPRLVLFDEPTAGMSAAETHRFTQLVESLPSAVTTVIVEHDLDVVFRLADRISVLAAGRLIAEGSPEDVRADPAVNEAYLGDADDGEPLFLDSPAVVAAEEHTDADPDVRTAR